MTEWLYDWNPEDKNFWESKGSKIAWWTLFHTTIALTFSFATWFVVSALVVRLPGIGFSFTASQLFWLASMPGLAGGTLRIVHTFLIPIYGTRTVLTIATFAKIVPCIGLGLAVMNPGTPFWAFMVLAFLAGLGGGDFSSHMPSTSLFFPKRLQGTALGIQAGVANFGVCLTQFITPWIIGFSIFGILGGGPQTFTKIDPVSKEVISTHDIWLQNATYWYVPFLFIGILICGKFFKSIPVKASFKEQLDIFKSKHTWFCTVTYIMTFGSFSGLAATFPLLIKGVYGGFPDAPDPLKYAFLGPLVGSLMRVVFGPIADKLGGAILTQISGFGLIAGCLYMVFSGVLTPSSLDSFPYFVGSMLALFLFSGMGNASTFRQYPIIFGHSPRQAAGVLGWTAAVAAYGPFIFSSLIGAVTSATGSPRGFFLGWTLFCLIGTIINWWFYTRKGCEKPC